MRALTHLSIVMYAGFVACVHAKQADLLPGNLLVPSQGLKVELGSGIVSRNGISDQCLETVSKSAGNVLTISRKPGDDHPIVRVNGFETQLSAGENARARLGAIRLTPDGALVHLRSWKTGNKQTELLINGVVQKSWPRGNTVRLLKANRDALLLLETDRKEQTHLQRYGRLPSGTIASVPDTLQSFGACRVDRVRLAADDVWAQMGCGEKKGIFKSGLTSSASIESVSINRAAEFASLTRRKGQPKGISVSVATGSPAALHFYYAATGLLTSQTGEVRACMSDAEGLQSWNQSYRLRALGLLFEKTGARVFEHLASKSMKLTLASQDKEPDATGLKCGWSSRIYVPEIDGGQKLMINQAVIANALNDACYRLGDRCPAPIRTKISSTTQCLAKTFEPDFEKEIGLYRIGAEDSFKHAGKIAPWNWQVSFASLLSRLSDPEMRHRATEIVENFRIELTNDKNGSLWRYWPEAYYLEKGYNLERIEKERFEDTGHAGISLLSLSQFRPGLPEDFENLVANRADFLLGFKEQTPRDLDGTGPRSQRWYLSGGWADFPSKKLERAYTEPVPSRRSADAIYVYARLFDPNADFELQLETRYCDETCQPGQKWTYTSWQDFLSGNPFFRLGDPTSASDLANKVKSASKQLKNHGQ